VTQPAKGFSAQPGGANGRRPLLFIELDGATWNLITPLIARGRLPNLAGLISRGCAITTRSMEPLLSSIIWTSIHTGKGPESHGVKDFYATAKTVRSPRTWDILERHGYRVGLLGELVTWPPGEVNGFNVPDLLAQDDQTYPPELSFINQLIRAERVRRRLGAGGYLRMGKALAGLGLSAASVSALLSYLAATRLSKTTHLERYYLSRLVKLRFHTDLFRALLKRYKARAGFIHVHFLDSCCHNFWRFMDREHFPDGVSEADRERYGGYIERAYEEADAAVGRLLELTDEQTLVAVVSDHGFGPNTHASGKRAMVIKIEELLGVLGLAGRVRYSNVRLGLHLRPENDDPKIAARLEEGCRGIVSEGADPKPVFTLKGLPSGGYGIEPNWELPAFEGFRVRVNGASEPVEKFLLASGDVISGAHDIDNAVAIFAGEGIRPGRLTGGVGMMDILPTVLYGLGLPVAKDMEGRIITAAFTGAFLSANEPRYVETYEEGTPEATEEGEVTEEVQRQLRNLGYL